jgi:molybdate transport system substrate-binding protein
MVPRFAVSRAVGALLVLVGVAFTASCGNGSPATEATSSAAGGVTGELKVFAAASLTESFTQIGEDLKDANPGLKITFNFAASSALVQQIEQGAEVDVFASADEANMAKLTDADPSPIESPKVFARNKLAIVVGKGNPKDIEKLADLSKSGTVVVLCGSQVPCGKFADEALGKAGVTVDAASREENVKAVLTKVQLGEADAGLVYVTDVRAAGDKVVGVDIPDEDNVVATYPIAVMKEAKNAAAARAFADLVTSADGARTLQRFGFMPPA